MVPVHLLSVAGVAGAAAASPHWASAVAQRAVDALASDLASGLF